MLLWRVLLLLESSPVYEGIKTTLGCGYQPHSPLESSPVYEGIKTKGDTSHGEVDGLESSPVYEGIKTEVNVVVVCVP